MLCSGRPVTTSDYLAKAFDAFVHDRSYLRQIRNAARLGGHELVQPFESRVHPVRPCSEETNQPMVGAAKAADGCLAAHAALCSQ